MRDHARRRPGTPAEAAEIESRAAVEMQAAQADAGIYVDVHAWFFSPLRFRRLMLNLEDQGLIDLHVERIHATGYGTLEFFAVLRKRAAH